MDAQSIPPIVLRVQLDTSSILLMAQSYLEDALMSVLMAPSTILLAHMEEDAPAALPARLATEV